jgi:peptidoglycan hydrolase-like protein with peptidoglycan-binding domain
LTEPADANDGADVAAESALGLNAITLRLVEARLRQLGLEPGQVDGTLDAESRRALRNFQRDRSLTISGFLNEETIVRLLADGLKSLGD